MNSRERVLAALAHQEPDRVPVDFGSTWITTVTIAKYEELKRHFGVDSPTVVMERAQQVCMVDERILDAFHVDTRGVFYGLPTSNAIGLWNWARTSIAIHGESPGTNRGLPTISI